MFMLCRFYLAVIDPEMNKVQLTQFNPCVLKMPLSPSLKSLSVIDILSICSSYTFDCYPLKNRPRQDCVLFVLLLLIAIFIC
jgi:hypothetical protein